MLLCGHERRLVIRIYEKGGAHMDIDKLGMVLGLGSLGFSILVTIGMDAVMELLSAF